MKASRALAVPVSQRNRFENETTQLIRIQKQVIMVFP